MLTIGAGKGQMHGRVEPAASCGAAIDPKPQSADSAGVDLHQYKVHHWSISNLSGLVQCISQKFHDLQYWAARWARFGPK